jgi:hypothetical protein
MNRLNLQDRARILGCLVARDFVRDLSERLASCVQLTTDGNRYYLAALDGTFGSEIDCHASSRRKVENHIHALALHYMRYNFGRIHRTLRITPAMQARNADHIWTLEEIANLAGRLGIIRKVFAVKRNILFALPMKAKGN